MLNIQYRLTAEYNDLIEDVNCVGLHVCYKGSKAANKHEGIYGQYSMKGEWKAVRSNQGSN